MSQNDDEPYLGEQPLDDTFAMDGVDGMSGKAPNQMDVYFSAFPAIAPRKLQDWINGCDPDESDTCEVKLVSEEEMLKKHGEFNVGQPAIAGGIRLSGLIVTLGDFAVMALAHNVPSPAGEEVIGNSRLSEEMKKELLTHQAFILLSLFGGDQYAPIEKTIFLFKIVLGLAEQGAIGVGNPHVGIAFPARILAKFHASTPGMGSPDNKPMTLWRSMREFGEPRQLLTEVVGLPPAILDPQADKGILLLTRGHVQLGFPNLMIHAASEKDAAKAAETLINIYHYLFENGPVIADGHTIGLEKGGAVFRFSTPPPTFHPPFDPGDVLLVTSEERKKRFGLF